MFFLHELEQIITLHPSFFGPKVRQYLQDKLYKDVEGTCNGSFYTICVVDIVNFSEGKIVAGSGIAEYTVRYRCVVWRPFRGEAVSNCADFATLQTLLTVSRLTLRSCQ